MGNGREALKRDSGVGHGHMAHVGVWTGPHGVPGPHVHLQDLRPEPEPVPRPPAQMRRLGPVQLMETGALGVPGAPVTQLLGRR